MSYLIRTRDDRLVGVHTGPAVERMNVPDDEAAERFDAVEEFEARLAELEPDRPTGPTAQDVLDAIRELAAEGAEVEKRIHERANAKAQERAQA